MTARQRRRLNGSALAGYFSHVIISEEVAYRKPDPAIFQTATQRVGVRPTDGLMIGDDPITDVVGAQAAGMRTAWINRHLAP
jgi:putative hydrolase of the HAD superfamily